MSASHEFPGRITLETDEQTMIRLSQQGDQEMFARIYEAYRERIQGYISFRMADHELASDITSQMFLNAWQKLDTYQAGQLPFMTWLYRIAHNAIMDHHRTMNTVTLHGHANLLELRHTNEAKGKLKLQSPL